MSRVAMIMAGGSGTRMRASGVDVPKVLVPIAGTPLLEWNVRLLLRFGFSEIIIVVPSGGGAVTQFARGRIAALVAGAGGTLAVIEETVPLGNIGAVQMVAADRGPLLVVYADNLTALDLDAIYRHHEAGTAAMTIATHEQPFRMPFGEVQLDGTQVVGYREKPVITLTVCSAISVIGAQARGAIAPDEPLGISQLVLRLIAQDLPVAAYPHEAPWIDVNDSEQVRAAERLVADAAVQFGLADPVAAP